MVETRGQTGNAPVKTENLNNTNSSSGAKNIRANKSREAKSKASTNIKKSFQTHHQVKTEDETDGKSSLNSPPKSPKRRKPQQITQNQIKQIIHLIENHSMDIRQAANKAKVSYMTARYYYAVYQNDVEKKLPVPLIKNPNNNPNNKENIQKLIHYMVDENMSPIDAAAKANVSYRTAYMHCRSLSKKSTRNKHSPHLLKQKNTNDSTKMIRPGCTQDQVNRLICYIVNNKMSVREASIKANMSYPTGKKYYLLYLNDPNHDIPIPPKKYGVPCAQECVKKLIGYIVDDHMHIDDAAKKAEMANSTARKYYNQYLREQCYNDPDTIKDRINEVINYVTKGKMSIAEASRKANVSELTARKHYKKYLESKCRQKKPHSRQPISQEKVAEFIGYAVDDKMAPSAAAEKTGIALSTGKKYYRIHLSRKKKTHSRKRISQEKVDEFIGYVVDDNMTPSAAAEKTGISIKTGKKYYEIYLNQQERAKQVEKVDQVSHESKDYILGGEGPSVKQEVCNENGQNNKRQTTFTEQEDSSKSLTQLVQGLEQHLKNKDTPHTAPPELQPVYTTDNNRYLTQLVEHLKQQLKDKDENIALLKQAHNELRKSSDTTIETFRMLVHSKEMEIDMLKKNLQGPGMTYQLDSDDDTMEESSSKPNKKRKMKMEEIAPRLGSEKRTRRNLNKRD